MRPIIYIMAVMILSMLAIETTNAVTYQYISAPLNSFFGTTLNGHPIIFDFTTYGLLPPNLSFSPDVEPPASSLPVIDWSISIGQYQATGIGNPAGGDATIATGGDSFVAGYGNDLYLLEFDTNSVGAITGWYLFLSPVTTDGKSLIAVDSELPSAVDTIWGPVIDYVQVNPNVIGTSYIDAAGSTDPGVWILLDPTVIKSVPEPSTWAMTLLGFVGLGWIARVYRRKVAA